MSISTLTVLIAGNIAGLLTQDNQGSLSFTYERNYSGPPLSISMPVSNRVYKDKQIRPYLFGLLPDEPSVRRSLGAEHGVSGNNPFALLRYSGLDCPGAVQICSDSELESLSYREDLTLMDEESISLRLKASHFSREASWTDIYEHWSLGGQQFKFALRLKDKQWFKCLGASATTHIFKPGIDYLKHQALNEYACMKLASMCSIPTAEVAFKLFKGEPALIISRYDRFASSDGNIVRLHQEDFCQALAVLPENKYTENGGPGASDIIRVLSKTEHFAESNIKRFCEMLFFNYLIGAPDAHAKNYSLLHGPSGEVILAPLYDIASLFPYMRKREQLKTAMSIGGENRLGYLKQSNLERFVNTNNLEHFGLDKTTYQHMLVNLASSILEFSGVVFNEISNLPGGKELRGQFETPLVQHCEQTLERFS